MRCEEKFEKTSPIRKPRFCDFCLSFFFRTIFIDFNKILKKPNKIYEIFHENAKIFWSILIKFAIFDKKGTGK